MPREYKSKNIHTSPEKAGELNLQDAEMATDEGINDILMPVREKGKANIYKGQWSDSDLMKSVDEFFAYCVSNKIKPTIPLLRLWLGISKSQFNDWRANSVKYGEKSVIINMATDFMEAYLQANIDKYPTGSIFLLKTSHGHAEVTKIDVSTNQNTSTEEINDVIGKLGLDKPKSE